jgi:hypothetical protein
MSRDQICAGGVGNGGWLAPMCLVLFRLLFLNQWGLIPRMGKAHR